MPTNSTDPSGQDTMTLEEARALWLREYINGAQVRNARWGSAPKTANLYEYILSQRIVIITSEGNVDPRFVPEVPIKRIADAKISNQFTADQVQKIKNAQAMADTMLQKAEEILDNERLWTNATNVFKDTNHLGPDLRVLAMNRDFYKNMVKTALREARKNPPNFQPGNESVGSGPAYCPKKGAPIYLKKLFFTVPLETETYLIIHEYGRTYLWDFLTKDESQNANELERRNRGNAPTNEKEWIENFDKLVQGIDKNYYRIKYLGK